MNYAKSGIFSGKEKLDCKNLALTLNFKNERLDEVAEFLKLVELFFFEKFAEDFIFDIYLNGEDVLMKPLRKKLQNMKSYIERNIELTCDGILKSEGLESRAQYRKLIDDSLDFGCEIDFEIDNIAALKKHIIDNINRKEINRELPPSVQDIGLVFSCDYISREEAESEEEFGYTGNLRFNISGCILDYDYEYFTEYLKDFLRSSSKILKSQCANIFVSDRYFATDYFSTFATMEVEKDERCLLEGLEGINFVGRDLFEMLDKSLIEENGLIVEKCANGFFVNVDKPLEKVDIDDKYKLRAILDDVLIKGSSHIDLIQFDELLGRVPIYLDEITIAENNSLEEMVGGAFEVEPLLQQEDESFARGNFLSRVFVISSNSEVESYDLDENIKKYKINEQ